MGRPKKDKEINPLVEAPPDAAPKPAAKKKATVNAKMAGAVVGAVQMILASLPWTQEDTLSETEQAILARDIVSFAKANQFFAQIIVWAFGLTSQAGLPVDVAAMTGVRLANHQMVPMEVGLGASMVLAISAANIQSEGATDAGPEALANLFGGLMGQEETATMAEEPMPAAVGD